MSRASVPSPAPVPATVQPRLILGDDHGLVAEGVRLLLESRYRVVGIFADGSALVEAALDLRPDLIVADIHMPVLNGLRACEEIRKEWPEARVLILSLYQSTAYLRRIRELGARGFVSKNVASAVLLDALDAVMAGATFFPDSPEDGRGEGSGEESGGAGARDRTAGAFLTRRQKEILLLVARGLSAREIASRIGLSPRTVEFHKRRIQDELGLRSTPELVTFAAREYPAEVGGLGEPAGPAAL